MKHSFKMNHEFCTIGSITLSGIALTVLQVELRGEGALNHDAAAIAKAREGMEKAIPIAKNDPNRPVYHLLPEAQWMNDPNGAFFADGWFHVFYQHNPYDNGWGHMHWGHARSRDNVIWERLPVGVWPSTTTCGSAGSTTVTFPFTFLRTLSTSAMQSPMSLKINRGMLPRLCPTMVKTTWRARLFQRCQARPLQPTIWTGF
jgi:hypothetical protein